MTESNTTPTPESSPRPEQRDSPDVAAIPAAPPVPEAPAPASPLDASLPSEPPAPETPVALDQGTYTAIREPRAEGRLALDGHWHQISPKYVVSQTVQNAIFVVVVLVAAFIVSLLTTQWWPWAAAAALVVVTAITQIVLPRQARALGYMLRGDDIVFRKGILWQRMVAVPYGRMQLVDITHGPMDRAFGIAKLKMITAAATSGVEIPGLSQQASEMLRDTLIEVAETRRTGL